MEKTFICFYSDDWFETLHNEPDRTRFPPNWNWRLLSLDRLKLMRDADRESVPEEGLKIARRHGAVVEITEAGLVTYYAPGSRSCPTRNRHLIRSLTNNYKRIVELGPRTKW